MASQVTLLDNGPDMKMYFLLDMVEFHVSFTRRVFNFAKVFSYNKSIKSRSKHSISYPQEYFLIAVTFMFLNLVGHTTSFYLESVTLAAGWTWTPGPMGMGFIS